MASDKKNNKKGWNHLNHLFTNRENQRREEDLEYEIDEDLDEELDEDLEDDLDEELEIELYDDLEEDLEDDLEEDLYDDLDDDLEDDSAIVKDDAQKDDVQKDDAQKDDVQKDDARNDDVDTDLTIEVKNDDILEDLDQEKEDTQSAGNTKINENADTDVSANANVNTDTNDNAQATEQTGMTEHKETLKYMKSTEQGQPGNTDTADKTDKTLDVTPQFAQKRETALTKEEDDSTSDRKQKNGLRNDSLQNRNSLRNGGVYRKQMNRKKRQQQRVFRLGLLAIVTLMILIGVVYMIDRVTPTKELYSGYQYFGVSQSDKVLVIVDDTSYEQEGTYVDGQLYLLQEFVADAINVRFYYDSENDSILYTDSEAVYSFKKDTTTYSDSLGNSYSSDYPVFKQIDGENYVNFEYVAQYTNITYTYASSPERVVINTIGEELNYVIVTKNSAVRYRAGIKSKVLENVLKDDQLIYVSTVDDWTEVITPSGYTGYIKTSCLSEMYSETPEDTFVDNYETNLKNYKISMGWFQVTNTSANDNVGQYVMNATGLNTISPTWYSISDANGQVTSLATSTLVSTMHARGVEVWPLIDDFTDGIDYNALYSSKTARTTLIQNLMSEAATYGFDGYNIDFENIKADYAQDYLQFIRELSIQCQINGLVLSIDNYKPEVYNSYYNLEEQACFADYVIIMGYDEHYTGSEAGSVASISFVKEGIEDALTMVPNDQLINAVPFYTRIWTVSDSGTTTSQAVGMQAAIDNMSESGAPALWDDTVGQYFGSYDIDGATVKIWFEEDKSIAEKMKLIQENDLAGVAAWKLGMEKDSVWSVINSYLTE